MGLLTLSLHVARGGCVDHCEGIAEDATHAFVTRLIYVVALSNDAVAMHDTDARLTIACNVGNRLVAERDSY